MGIARRMPNLGIILIDNKTVESSFVRDSIELK